MIEIDVSIKKINKNAKIPVYQTNGSAGMDLSACIDEPITIKPGQIVKVPIGIAIQINDKFTGGFVFPRSGISSKFGISLANCVGVIDSDYTGELNCPVINHGKEDFIINSGDRIAQLVFMPVNIAKLTLVDDLIETERGSGGFGSTGLK